ncbi:MAG: preprotein translocase subunit SecA [Clostridia bacterium]|nr:preprotein translocase subunit SecA [Clostridia bacterium]
MGLLSYIFASDNSRYLKKLDKIAQKIEDKSDFFASLSDDELRDFTPKLKNRLANGESINDILPDAFALVREASTRVLKERPYHVQLIGGIVLHQGRIAEMRTGEGKTLTATMPSYLNAIAGIPVHIVTVNEYLATYQSEKMGKLYKFLGLTVGVSLAGQDNKTKKAQYDCDVLYTTNNELGFDYLRDNMVPDAKYRVQRGHRFCVVDEVDSILIDEARTPLIISGSGTKTSELYNHADRFIRTLKESDYEIEQKHQQIRLTEEGVDKAEKFFNIENLSDISALELNHHINNALRAHHIMKRDINYIVKDDEVLIVDEFTGRLMPGRRFNNGLHQAIEAKEGVKIKDENKTLATITFQNYFKLYDKLSGMTGTAKTEETEFNKIYNLDVVTIPTNKPNQRIDEPDIVFFTKQAKINAILEEILDKSGKGQPILVGTSSIEKSEEISNAIRKRGIKHTVLNAKNHELESNIVAQAGRKNAVTIATNMAGRGTDIMLGGNPEFLAKSKMLADNVDAEILEKATAYNVVLNEEELVIKKKYDELFNKFKEVTDNEKLEVIALGGLHILGTERHESRRIDNQLRGRSGRQGDPGSSVFFISLEDDLPQRFGEDRLKKLFSLVFRGNEDMPLQSKMLTRFFETAQKKTEGHNFSIRKRLLEYDDVLNKQRTIIYGERNKVLDGENVHNQVVEMMKDFVHDLCYKYLDSSKPWYEWDLDSLNKALEDKLIPKGTNMVDKKLVEDCGIEQATNNIFQVILDIYDKKVSEVAKLGLDFAQVERAFLLRTVDNFWTEHIDEMNILQNEIGVLAYGQRDPIIAYKNEGFDMFDKMIDSIREYTASVLYRVQVNVKVETGKAPTMPTSTSKMPAKSTKTPGRNDPCPCGSGKKYKNCCMNKE